MTPLQVAQYVRSKTHTNTTTLPDATILLYAGVHMDELSARIIKMDENYFGIPETRDLINGQREYPLPNDVLNRIKKVEAQLDTTVNPPQWYDLRRLDLNQYKRTTDELTITQIFSNMQDNAYYDVYRGSLFLYTGPLQNFVTGNQALKLWTFEWPTHLFDLTLTTDMSVDPNNTSAGFPRIMHRDLCDMIVISYKDQSDKNYQPNDYEKGLESRIREHLSTLSPLDENQDYTMVFPPPWKFGNDGFDY